MMNLACDALCIEKAADHAGGIIGKITKVPEKGDVIVIALNDKTEITINRNYIAAVLPKGTIETL